MDGQSLDRDACSVCFGFCFGVCFVFVLVLLLFFVSEDASFHLFPCWFERESITTRHSFSFVPGAPNANGGKGFLFWILGPPAKGCPLSPFFGWFWVPIDYTKQLVPTYSNLSTRPRICPKHPFSENARNPLPRLRSNWRPPAAAATAPRA